MKETNIPQELIIKMDIPFWFYAYRVILVSVPLLMLFLKVDYGIIIVTALVTLLFISNDHSYVIEVYSDHFKLILPSFWFNLFKEEEAFYYEDISNYSFEKGNFSLFNFLLLELVRSITRNHFIGGLRDYQQYSSIEFEYIKNNKIRKIKREFSLFQTKGLLEVNKCIEDRTIHLHTKKH